MRTEIDVYDRLLELHMQASYDKERRLFEFEAFEAARTIIDLGCGNAAYAGRLAVAFPAKRFIGIEPSEPLLERGLGRAPRRNLELLRGSFDDLPPAVDADVLLARFVMMHVDEPESLARSVAARRIPTVVVIDAADDLSDLRPRLPRFIHALESGAAQVRNRDIERATVGIWERAGYELVAEQDIVVRSTAMKPLMHLLMILNAELAVGTPLDPPLIEELHDWVFDDDAYLQYGLRARRLRRAGGGR